jgi:hypothetical protein
MGVKQSRMAMFNYRLRFKGLKYPSPDPTIPAKDFLLKVIYPLRVLMSFPYNESSDVSANRTDRYTYAVLISWE